MEDRIIELFDEIEVDGSFSDDTLYRCLDLFTNRVAEDQRETDLVSDIFAEQPLDFA